MKLLLKTYLCPILVIAGMGLYIVSPKQPTAVSVKQPINVPVAVALSPFKQNKKALLRYSGCNNSVVEAINNSLRFVSYALPVKIAPF